MIGIIFPYRNREVERVKRSLDSLSLQENHNFKVIFVDYGSDLASSSAIKELIFQYKFASYIYSFSEFQPWSRAKALNIGLKNTTADYVFTADVDMIFSPNFISKLYELRNPLKAYYFKVGFLSEKESKADKKFEDYSIDFNTGVGAQGLSLFYLKNVEEIGGYDEFLHFWGAEDIDIHERLIRTGTESIFYNEETLLLHQWHQSYRKSETAVLIEGLQLKGVVQLNHQHLKSNQKNKVTKVNNEKWGNLISEADFNELETADCQITLNNKLEVIDHFLFVELPQYKDKIVSVQFTKDDFQDSLKYKVKKLLGKTVPQYYSLKEINDRLLLHIISFYHTYPYSFKIDKNLKSIRFKIKK
ncbi:glycosyltransferase family 2 protein [Flavobacterium sp. 17A]|uniref:Glycosyltransferase family 2 protein n=2 Tax=Flavobacterium potami TaxID=2872310 RepID=A0A9X1HDE6_9FLAO|nr:glycosyltransferase family A protein [Flavobacterium potami]MBZ4036572.1 glycosyltransferase family 2 protein [Flavobacterium potami]